MVLKGSQPQKEPTELDFNQMNFDTRRRPQRDETHVKMGELGGNKYDVGMQGVGRHYFHFSSQAHLAEKLLRGYSAKRRVMPFTRQDEEQVALLDWWFDLWKKEIFCYLPREQAAFRLLGTPAQGSIQLQLDGREGLTIQPMEGMVENRIAHLQSEKKIKVCEQFEMWKNTPPLLLRPNPPAQ